MSLQAIKYSNSGKVSTLQIIDQLKLPHEVQYVDIKSTHDAYWAIRSMQVRGAPAIAIVGMLAVAIELESDYHSDNQGDGFDDSQSSDIIKRYLDYITQSRPTAVNLQNAAHNFHQQVVRSESYGAGLFELIQLFRSNVETMLKEDIINNRRMADHGSEYILRSHKLTIDRNHHDAPVSVITHCNTGSLATAGYGTAMGVIRSLHAKGNLLQAYCTESRPYNQGSRLTAFELVHDEIPATLITDSMAGALIKLKKDSANIAAVVVGADRIAANGDTANKIGTYALAVLANYHRIPFYVVANMSTFDFKTRNGESIKIEQRAPEEMTRVSGPRVLDGANLELGEPATTVQVAADGIDVWNPGFDITPANLISAIITEKGVIPKIFFDDPTDPNPNLLMKVKIAGFWEAPNLSV
ncbi:MAG: S-methyl-5-thioribose-1-phosphate isomerase [Alyxoria varia]|nr:MAG: S-methyl-5-thioribose-1-phosphate isomerase [Alyxoria varia]